MSEQDTELYAMFGVFLACGALSIVASVCCCRNPNRTLQEATTPLLVNKKIEDHMAQRV